MNPLRPFLARLHRREWQARNCDRCLRLPTCRLVLDLVASFTVSRETARRIGFTGAEYLWDCPEREDDDRQGELFPPPGSAPAWVLALEVA